MGARINFVFDDGTDNHVVLYSHWGADSWQEDLANAFAHAEPRKGDTSYWTRMVISYLLKDAILEETGFGIYGILQNDIELIANQDLTLMIDCKNQLVSEL